MKTEEDEAFDEIARKQGHWAGGFMAKRAMAADKLQEDRINYGTAWSQDGKRIDPMSVYKEPMTEREALKLALDALDSKNFDNCDAWCNERDQAITAIKEALAQPAQKTWVSLTPEQVQECADNSYYHTAWSSEIDLALFAQNLDVALRKANT